MRNPFKTPLPLVNMSPGREIGTPGQVFDAPAPETQPDNTGNYPDYTGSLNTPLPYHGTKPDTLYQESNPAYAGEYNPSFLAARGVQPDFSQLAPAPGSENLRVARQAGETPGTNRLFQSHGPVNGGNASPGWTGKNTSLRTPVVGNSGPVSGGRDNAAIASTAYFAAQAAQFSQAASDAAMISAL